jgi:hypothetical protein
MVAYTGYMRMIIRNNRFGHGLIITTNCFKEMRSDLVFGYPWTGGAENYHT